MFVWLLVVAVALGALWGVALTLANGRKQEQKLSDAIANVEKAERTAALGYDPYEIESRRLASEKSLLKSAIEKDESERRLAVGNVIFAAMFVCAELATVAAFLARPLSVYRTAVLWGATAGAGAALVGALSSQYAPLWHGLVRGPGPFTVYQLGYLLGHTLLAATVGVAAGACASAVRERER